MRPPSYLADTALAECGAQLLQRRLSGNITIAFSVSVRHRSVMSNVHLNGGIEIAVWCIHRWQLDARLERHKRLNYTVKGVQQCLEISLLAVVKDELSSFQDSKDFTVIDRSGSIDVTTRVVFFLADRTIGRQTKILIEWSTTAIFADVPNTTLRVIIQFANNLLNLLR